jgi:hypothetical protein
MKDKMKYDRKTGKTYVELNQLVKEEINSTPIRSIKIIKGNQEWFAKKLHKLKKEISAEYFNAMKLSYNGTKGLTNKWLIWEHAPIGGYQQYKKSGSRRKKRIREFLNLVWKNYKITNHTIYTLDEFEKLKALDFQLNKIIQMGELSLLFKKLIKKFWY